MVKDGVKVDLWFISVFLCLCHIGDVYVKLYPPLLSVNPQGLMLDSHSRMVSPHDHLSSRFSD